MIQIVESADADALARFGDIIDVRTPAEFADDHIPGALNLPVLSNDERAQIGMIYVQESRWRARRLGAALVARNIARHLEGPLADKGPQFTPLVYCWRGGQRSAAMASVLSQVGWRVSTLEGGYRTYRRRVMRSLYGAAAAIRVILLDGDTGVAKTDILTRLPEVGVQTLDLEALASHRGSLFGAVPGARQPSQRMFESRLATAMDALDPNRPVVVEAESSRIGEIMIPPALWKQMTVAPAITLAAPIADRARYLTQAYADILGDLPAIEAAIEHLPRHIGKDDRQAWIDLARAGEFEGLAKALIEAHYDPAYRRSTLRSQRTLLQRITLPDLSVASRRRAAEEIALTLETPSLAA
ncbi:MAG TPA: tRNA 2-selenouridine(34) synthase MnmH [Caulobacteraceae bacterium]|nr:tRNA 2-selenouridine(34) synthase MnmH [Caulobacteraceae bacterium]